MNWLTEASKLAPLLAHADAESHAGDDGVLERVFTAVPERARFAVEFGQRGLNGATVGALVRRRAWKALFMDVEAPEPAIDELLEGGGQVRVVRETVTPDNLTALFERHHVPTDLDCLVIDIDGNDLWVWAGLDERYQPSLVVIEFNAHVDPRVQASLRPDPDWRYARTRDYGASYAALCAVAKRKGYRLVHVHGCWNLYFLREGLAWPAELTVKQPLSVDEFRFLTDTEMSFDTLVRKGARPSWYAQPMPDVSRAPWQLLPTEAPRKTVNLYDLHFEVLGMGSDPGWYQQRKTFEERASLLYPLLAADGFRQFVDIGANVGMVSMLAKRAIPDLRVLAVEADPKLAAIARHNLEAQGLHDVELFNAAAGDCDEPAVAFSQNPGSSLDNRVVHGKWPQVHVPMRRIDGVLRRLAFEAGPTFFKVDTQGYELQVLRGLEGFLTGRSDWVLKMEFAPDWLRSQGTDPLQLLDYLMLRYEMVEYPERIVFGTPSLSSLFAFPLTWRKQREFLAHVEAQNKGGQGWVDLLVGPKTA